MKSLKISLAILMTFLFFTESVLAASSNKILRASVIDASDPIEGSAIEVQPVAYKSASNEVCGFDLPEKQEYNADVLAIRRKLKIDEGEIFAVKVFLKNSGNMPWFSNSSTCLGPKMSLGTYNELDHPSIFYDPELKGWEANNRIAMDQLRVDPGEVASFTFEGNAGDDNDVYKEFYAPVLKEIKWLSEKQFPVEVIVGDFEGTGVDLRRKMSYANFSGSVNDIDLDAEKEVLVDLSEQKLRVKLGDHIIREFKVSTGKAATPTPKGEFKISLKQDVRIGGDAPHYIMPKYMMFKKGGYGFHALPSLGSANLRTKIKTLQASGKAVPTSLYEDDPFWSEALDHIGRPVSHGCIRLLPEDADFMYEFAEIGTKISISY